MDYRKMAVMARELANVSESDYSDDRLLPFFNAVKDDLWTYLITAIRSNYNWDIWTVGQTVIGATEYNIPEAASDQEGNLKISDIGICYNGDTYSNGRKIFKKAKLVDPQSLPNHWNYYLENQSKDSPIYYISDRSIFIAPAFDIILSDAIELSGIKNIIDYTTTSTEADIKLPTYLHMDLVQGVLPFIHKSEGRKDDASYEQKIYEQQRSIAAKKFANRKVGPTFLTLPN